VGDFDFFDFSGDFLRAGFFFGLLALGYFLRVS